ncbi:acid protease [Poronia punctata]|nr:acid protease [Poronia punctata]
MIYDRGVLALLLTWTAVPCVSARTKRASSDDRPKALSVPPSQYFEGNDGPWSTFDLRVGSDEQDVRVTVSTASPQTFVVLSDGGCSDSTFEKVPDNCAVSRGKLFNPEDSSSWTKVGKYGINADGVGLEANLGYYQEAEFGLETLGLGLTGPRLKNQTVAGVTSADHFYLGAFGLNSQPVNFTSIGNYSAPSFLTTLKDQGHIPSLSWSYTAGAKYRLKQVYGQLIFSGYDTSRFIENSASFTMAGDLTRDLVVVLQSISYSGTTSDTLLSDPIDIFIDSTDPNLWLPEKVCDAFEEAFGLTLDDKSGLYLVNETHHDQLLNSDAEVTFRISDVMSGGDAVKITLPYAAFDLKAEYPLVDEPTYYFPLKRAANETQYTLGRTFLQEAYLTADYERQIFNVSACSWRAGAEEEIVTILSKDDCSSDSCTTPGSGPGSGSGSASGSDSSLGGGAIAGIVVGAVVGALLIAAIIFYCIHRQRKKKRYAAREPEPDMDVITGPVYNHASTRTGKYFSPDTIGTSTEAGTSHRVSPIVTNSGSNGESHRTSVLGENGQPELDGEETQVQQIDSQPAREPTPVLHELAGTEVTRPPLSKEAVSTLGDLPGSKKQVQREEGDDHLDSPFVSTVGSLGWQDDAASDLVSPVTTTRRGSRQFDKQKEARSSSIGGGNYETTAT